VTDIPERQKLVEFAEDDSRISRRTLLRAGAILSAAGMVAVGGPVFAQDATPEAGTDSTIDATPTALPVIPPEVERYANDWPLWQQNYAATRVAPSSVIDLSNIGTLGVAWELPVAANAPFGVLTSNPIVLGNTVYLIDNGSNIHSIDLASGAVNWTVQNDIPTDGPCGLQVGYGKLIAGLGDKGDVQAVDPATGEILWQTTLTEHFTLGINQPPVIYNGLAYVSTAPGGNTKGRYGGGAEGVFYAIDVEDGTVIWSWDTVEGDLWGNFAVNSGGGLWYPPSIDVETGVIFAGIGNAAPFPGTEDDPNASQRMSDNFGENLYANCLVAIDPAQGRVLWYINMKPRDLYDHDNQQTPVLGTVNIGGFDAPVVFTSGKHGYVAAVHRASGQEFWRRSVGRHENDGLAEFPDELLSVYPGIWGGVQSPMAFKDGVLYLVAFNWTTSFSSTAIGGISAEGFDLTSSTAELIALDGATGEFLWVSEIPIGVTGSGPTISNDLLFLGSLDGVIRAFSIVDGSQVWSLRSSAGINAPFAVVNDTVLVPAGSFIVSSVDQPEPVPGLQLGLVALRLGATGTITYGEPVDMTAATPSADSDGTTAEVHAFDLGYNPSEVTIKADTDVTITFVNDGALQHDFVIENTDFKTELISGGESVDLVVNLPTGSYIYFCSAEGHRAAGMQGTLTVA
jgi:outer membrane protein assembly factor BamB/plastocyanin